MKKEKFVIDPSCLPSRSPIGFFVIIWLVMDRGAVPGWAWGVYWTIFALAVTGWLVAKWGEKSERVPGFGDKS